MDTSRSLERSADDSDWEYEYDDTETEDIYVTVDFSSLGTSSTRNSQKNEKPSNSASNIGASHPPNETVDTPAAVDSNTPLDHIQILDFATPNPIVSYQNQIYTCDWSSTLGTDILLNNPENAPPFPPLLEQPGFSILGTSNLRLIARPVRIVPRSESEPDKAMPGNPSAAVGARAENVAPGSDAVSIEVDPDLPVQNTNQARFLERLTAAKAARGENDSVYVGGSGLLSRKFTATAQRPHVAPSYAMDGDDFVDTPFVIEDEIGSATKRGRRNKGGRLRGRGRGMGGGLSRESTHMGGPSEDPNAGLSSEQTPKSWAKLGKISAENPGQSAGMRQVRTENSRPSDHDVEMTDPG